MICYTVNRTPKSGEIFIYDGRIYHLLADAAQCGMRGLLKATGRYTFENGNMDKDFYFDVKNQPLTPLPNK